MICALDVARDGLGLIAPTTCAPGPMMAYMDRMSGTAGGPAPEPGEARSADGTAIGYYRIGQEPPVVLLHRAGQSSENFSALANDLADSFTLFVPDRRGGVGVVRSASFKGFVARSRTLDASGVHNSFGLSSGAVIATSSPQRLRAALPRLPSSAGSHEESVAGSDEEKAQPCAHATRSRSDFRCPLLWTVSLSELNLAAELFSALTLQRLEQS